uniref:trypsin n=1 Tax=Pundamilia nyererei TaxID=303518 RepID=A0A3B4GWN7_9CICH
MFAHFNLAILTVLLILHDQVHAGEIIGGHETVPHSRPYMVLLQQNKANGHTGHCGGFLLNENFVLTAAHCHAETYKIFLGLHNYHDMNGVQHLHVEKAFPHDDYDANTFENDIMVLKLKSKAEFNDKVKSIALADHGDGSLPQSCVVSGWGRTKEGSHMSLKLLEVNVTLTDDERCAKEKFYCSKGETGPGKGDSGGPLVCGDGKAYGVVSTSSSPTPSASSIHRYTKIPTYKVWIDSIISAISNINNER